MKNHLFFLLFCISTSTFGQSIYESVYNTGIYNFLDRLSHRGIIKIFDDIRPITREKIAEKLLQVSKQSNKLNTFEKERLDFYKRGFNFEIRNLKKDTTKISEFLYSDEYNKFNFYKFYSKAFTFVADPIMGLGYELHSKTYYQFTGLQLYGRIDDNLSYYINYRDNLEKGNNLDRRKSFTPSTGIIISKGSSNNIEYSETRGGISYNWNWGMLTAAKDFINIGSSYQNQVILSDKAPSFPYIRLEVTPVDWFRYDFIHGWLNSDLIDSSTIRYTGVTSTDENRSLAYSRLQKYYVGHSFSFRPFNNWWFTLGESIIYGEKLEFIYFLPVFFRLADHYNSKGGGDTGDNAQIFFNTSYTWTQIKGKLYFSLYIDELSPESIFNNGKNAQDYAITIGNRFNNPLWDNNFLTLEYTAISPYNYMNADPLETYKSSDYQLGTWIGTNSTQIYVEMEQYLPHIINFKTYFTYIMKGAKENINNYYNHVKSTYPLLSGKLSYYSEIGAEISYNPVNDLFLDLKFSYINIASGRFESEYNIDKGISFTTAVRYGL